VIALTGLVVGAGLIVARIRGEIPVPGWTSVVIGLLVLLGGLYIAVAVVAEYVGQAVRNTVGRPVYVRVDPPGARALHVLSASLVASAVGGGTVNDRPGPDGPADPDGPTRPNGPDSPDAPDGPADPDGPTVPDDPDGPTDPDDPSR
jgi:hypothetical protein